MSIVRVKKDSGYFVAHNEGFNDESLSWGARGVLGYLLSKPDDWTIRTGDLIRRSPAGREKVQSLINELKAAGYMRRFRENNEKGHLIWVTEVYERRASNPDYSDPDGGDNRSTEKPTIGKTDDRKNRRSEKPTDGKPVDILNTDSVLNTDDVVNTEAPATADRAIETVLALADDWLTLTGGSRPGPESFRENYFKPLNALLLRVNWDQDLARGLLKDVRAELLADGKTPFRAAAVVPYALAKLDGLKENGQARASYSEMAADLGVAL